MILVDRSQSGKYKIVVLSSGTTAIDEVLYNLHGAANLGDGIGIYAGRNNRTLNFKSLKAGNNILIAPTSTGVTITAVVSATTASNGLIKVGNDVRFGGSLSDHTTLSVGSNSLTFLQSVGSINSSISLAGGDVSLYSSGSAGSIALELLRSLGIARITSSVSGFEGLKYGSNFSSNFKSRSLVDAGFVTGITTNLVHQTALQVVSNKYLFTGTTIGFTPTIISGAKFSFKPNSTVAGMNIGSISSTDPNTLSDFDLWGHSGSLTIRTRMGGSTRQIPYSQDNTPIAKSIPFIGFSNQMQLLYNTNFNFDTTTNLLTTGKLKIVDTPIVPTGTTEVLVRDINTGTVTAVNASGLTSIDRVNLSYSSSLTFNISSKEQKRFVITGTVTGNSSIVFSNSGNVELFTVDISPTATINLTMPSTTRMQQYEVDNSRWNTSTRVLTLEAGSYQLTFSYAGSAYKLNCSDKYV